MYVFCVNIYVVFYLPLPMSDNEQVCKRFPLNASLHAAWTKFASVALGL
jgi:hypothetical protein